MRGENNMQAQHCKEVRDAVRSIVAKVAYRNQGLPSLLLDPLSHAAFQSAHLPAPAMIDPHHLVFTLQISFAASVLTDVYTSVVI